MRNYVIDFIRGLVAICIVLIHTTFWSGQLYLPYEVSNLSLLIDVPAFMFIAGITVNFSKDIMKMIKGLLKLLIKYWYFIVIYSLILIIFYREQFLVKYVFEWAVFSFPKSNSLAVAGSSMWFMHMYIKVTVFCGLIIYACNYYSKKNAYRNLSIILLFMLYLFFYLQYSGDFLFINTQLAMYSVIYLMGYLSYKIKIKNIWHFLFLELLVFISFRFILHYFGLTIIDLQTAKGACRLLYFVFSLFSIIAIWYIKDRLKIKESNLIAKIGKNAIFFYFSQGISSSLLYEFIDKIRIDAWYYKLPIMFVINLVMALAIGFLLMGIYKLLSKIKLSKKIKTVINPFVINN